MSAPAIARTAWTDDDGTGAVGTVINNSEKTAIYDQIDDVLAVLYDAGPQLTQGRLTLTTAVPVTTSDVLAATTLRFTPYGGNRISLFDGTNWNMVAFSELSIAVPATMSQVYDVFVFSNAGVPTLELLAWTSDTARATALVLQDGVLVKSGATTRKYVGSFRTTTVSGQTEDSQKKRYVWNYYHRARRSMRVVETGNWAYTTATFRQANANAADQLDLVIGVAEDPIDVRVSVMAVNATSGTRVQVSIGEDSTTTPAANVIEQVVDLPTSLDVPMLASLITTPPVGRHTYVWLEKSGATGTTTWRGDLSTNGAGLSGTVMG